jgi:hypothetical protein
MLVPGAAQQVGRNSNQSSIDRAAVRWKDNATASELVRGVEGEGLRLGTPSTRAPASERFEFRVLSGCGRGIGDVDSDAMRRWFDNTK